MDLCTCDVYVPSHTKHQGRAVKALAFAPPHERLLGEFTAAASSAEAPLQPGGSGTGEWNRTFQSHPAVAWAREDQVPIHPVAMYMDGVRYTRSVTPGRMNSVIVFSVYNLLFQQRHILGILLKSELCRCGCRGWCSLFAVMCFPEWSFEAAAGGARPGRMYNGDAWPDDHELAQRFSSSPTMATRFALVQIRADWSEWCSTLGFPTWAANFSPCIFC